MLKHKLFETESLDSQGEETSSLIVDATDIDFCPICNSNGIRFLGTLGKLQWFECIDCGMEFNEHKLND